jgi:hypothetical protein
MMVQGTLPAYGRRSRRETDIRDEGIGCPGSVLPLIRCPVVYHCDGSHQHIPSGRGSAQRSWTRATQRFCYDTLGIHAGCSAPLTILLDPTR